MDSYSGYIHNELGFIEIKADSDRILSVCFSDTEPEEEK